MKDQHDKRTGNLLATPNAIRQARFAEQQRAIPIANSSKFSLLGAFKLQTAALYQPNCKQQQIKKAA